MSKAECLEHQVEAADVDGRGWQRDRWTQCLLGQVVWAVEQPNLPDLIQAYATVLFIQTGLENGVDQPFRMKSTAYVYDYGESAGCKDAQNPCKDTVQIFYAGAGNTGSQTNPYAFSFRRPQLIGPDGDQKELILNGPAIEPAAAPQAESSVGRIDSVTSGYLGFALRSINGPVLGKAHYRCDWTDVTGHTMNQARGCLFPDALPTLFYFRDQIPEIWDFWDHVSAALSNPNIPDHLHRVYDGSLIQQANLRAKRKARASLPRTSGQQCDEYPFNSSYEGAGFYGPDNQSFKYIVGPQNSRAGNYLGVFYNNDRVLGGDPDSYSPGDEFLVVLFKCTGGCSDNT